MPPLLLRGQDPPKKVVKIDFASLNSDRQDPIAPGDQEPKDSPMEDVAGGGWNPDRLARFMDEDSDHEMEVRDLAIRLMPKSTQLPPFVPPKPDVSVGRPAETARNAPPARPRLIPRGPSRHVLVDRQEYERFSEWAIGQRRKGWCREEQFVAANRRWTNPSNDYLEEMADQDYRRSNYGRYNGGGGGNNRKRKHYADDDEYDRPRHRRDNYERKVPLSARVRSQLLSIADQSERIPEDDCADLADLIAKNEQDSYFIEHITDCAVRLIVEQPFKVPHVAAIVLHINDLKKTDVVARVLTNATELAQTAIDTGDWRTVKLLLRFFAILSPIWEDKSALVRLLEQLFARASDLQMASSEDTLGIEVAKIIMLTIPYLFATDVEEAREGIESLLERVSIIASAPADTTLSVNPYAHIEGKAGLQLSSVLQLLPGQLQREKEAGYPLKVIPRIYRRKFFADDKVDDGEDEPDADVPTHAFPELNVPEKLNAGTQPLFPEVFFSLFADQDVESVPRSTQLASTILRDCCADTVNILSFNRDKVVEYLINVDNYFPLGKFAKRGTPFDHIRQFEAGEATWKPEDVLMDTIFSQLLILPAPEHKLVYYHSCITVACREAAAAVAPSLGRAIRFLYENLDMLDWELGYRFMDWFGHHLSNYDFRWKWAEWAADTDLPPLAPKNAFIRGVIDKEIRLSFAKRIRDSLPPAYHALVPESKDNEIPPFKYSDESTPFSAEGKTILAALKAKQADADILPTLSAITAQNPAAEADPGMAALPAIDAYTTALCFIGSKSLSHALLFIDRCRNRLLAFSRDAPSPAAADAARTQIIASTVAYWLETQPGVAVSIVDKLLNYGILSPQAVVAWALSAAPPPLPSATPAFLAESWLFEMVATTLGKVTNRVRQIVAARLSPDLRAAQGIHLDGSLERETADMLALFEQVDAALAAIEAAHDAEQRWWASSWRRVFERKRRVEQRLIAAARLRFPEPLPDEEMADADAADADVQNGENGAAPTAAAAGAGAEDEADV